ncbi:MAG: dual specificity protein phosphatase 23 [Nitrososphaeraceae archaeon]|nr:dual specificity protein phosphatase 23 [Nitrososphaeraceae archaeon]
MTKIGNTYRWFHGYLANRPTNFSWVIEDGLAGSGMPMTYSQLIWLIRNGIKAIVTIREVPLPSKWLANKAIDYFHLKVEDYGAPSLSGMDTTVNYVKEHINDGKPVMVHCAAGRGRTGTILAAYFLKNFNLTAEQAIKKIRDLRPGSIQSLTQEKAIEMYEEYLKRM